MKGKQMSIVDKEMIEGLPNRQRLVVIVEGGIVQEILAEVNTKVLIIDFDDVDDPTDDAIAIIDGKPRWAAQTPVTINKKRVAELYHQVFWKDFGKA